MNETALLGLLSGPALLIADRLLTWLRNRRKEDAEAGLTVDQRWKNYATKIEERVTELEGRVTTLEKERTQLRERIKGLMAEVDRYRTIARSMARHVLKLRDELARLNGSVLDLPTDIEDALTVIDLQQGG